jgi:hypothetical protein
MYCQPTSGSSNSIRSSTQTCNQRFPRHENSPSNNISLYSVLKLHSQTSSFRHRTSSHSRPPRTPRNSLPPIHTNRSNPHETMRHSHSLQLTTSTIDLRGPSPRRNSNRAPERRSRSYRFSASWRRRAGGDSRCAGESGGRADLRWR